MQSPKTASLARRTGSWLINTISAFLFLAAVGGVVYLALACVGVAAFARRRVQLASAFLPRISILKPIAGFEEGLYENLRSCCDQDYGAFYEVIFALRATDDSAYGIVERLAAEFPSIVRVALGENAAMSNPKIANLAKPGAEPRGEIVVIADSDIRVGRRYLSAIAASFVSEGVGATTCLYAGMPNTSLAARLGALQIDDGFIPSVLVALMLGKLRFCLGATMAVRRRVLAEIGGLEALGAGIADDHKLGELVAGRGYEIELSRYVVRTMVPETRLDALWLHELRWARTHFALAPTGYSFSFLTYAVPLALVCLAFSKNLAWGLPLLALAIALRFALHRLTRRALGVKNDDAVLTPFRDFLSLAIWVASFFSRSVRWRGRTYTVE
jgi:ceramide glucosyltransferase